jgi:hypothetical protein
MHYIKLALVHLIASLVWIGCNKVDSNSVANAAGSLNEMSNDSIAELSAVDSLVTEYDALKIGRLRDFSYQLEKKFEQRIVVGNVRIKDIIKAKDENYFIIGYEANTIFKIRATAKQIKDFDEIKGSRYSKYAIAISEVRVKQIYQLEVESDDYDQTEINFGLSRGKYLVQGTLVGLRR